LVVFTGLSGSGKSSLAFDTIYAEGQRKYVESLSVHARLFLEQIGKPEVERIEGLPPTLAIEQRSGAPNPRSTVATTTEIHDFLRLLFARLGVAHCPACETPLQRHTVDQIVDAVLQYPPDSRLMVLAPVARGRSGDHAPILRRIQREGFIRARVNGELVEVAALGELSKKTPVDIDVVVDRIVLKPEVRTRLADAVEMSLALAEGSVLIAWSNGLAGGAAKPAGAEWHDETFSEHHVCTRCGFAVPELAPRVFSFNSPFGACEACAGLGTTQRFDPELIIQDPGLAVSGGAIAPWAGTRKRLGSQYLEPVRKLCGAFEANPASAFKNLPEDLQRILVEGTTAKDTRTYGVEFEGVIPNLERRSAKRGEGARGALAAYQSDYACADCRGARLKPGSLAVTVQGMNIRQIADLSIEKAVAWFEKLRFDRDQTPIAEPIVGEIRRRLRFLNEVGLGYLTLDRASATLSGGEAQRIRLATQLGSGLVGVCYVLDEPTIGLHQRDNERLLNSIRRLVDLGNTVIVVEHDEDVIRAADTLVDIGPGAGLHGGRIIACGTPQEVIACPESITGRYLRGEYEISVPETRRTPRRSDTVRIIGASENNLRGIDVEFPLGVFCAVTGVSGSGKSTLVTQTLVAALKRRLYGSKERPGRYERIIGAHKIDKVIEIDQSAIGRTPRSNPATYTSVFDEVRRLYARTKEARIRGYQASRFSFNAKGGRCEACQGQGTRRIEMHFLPDVFVECGECRGTRYNRETLEVRYRGKSIADVLDMRVEEACRFFDSFPKITAALRALSDVGLGYVRLGQPSNTLSGGEAQRVKLASELAKNATGSTLYVLDEPTTGLHFADIHTLLAVLNRLVDRGNTVLVIEHNLDVIKTADWLIDMGPGGGEAGGEVVVAGSPEKVAECRKSFTAKYLRPKVDRGAE
jgi:excinuclease ABC subunit A